MAEPGSPHLTTHSAGGLLAIQRVRPNEALGLILRSPGVGADGRLADIHSAYYDGLSPALTWTGLPEAEAFALIVEDPDAPRSEPFVHWMMWNIPGEATGLQQGLSAHLPVSLAAATQGKNSAGKVGWMGAKPPEGHGPHRYHFQLFALDHRLPGDASMTLNDLVNMLKAHTIAMGELVATYERPDQTGAGAGQGTSPDAYR